MENPAVVVTIVITRPTPETVPWHQTDEGAAMQTIILSVLQSYGADIEITAAELDPLTTEVRIEYSSLEVYNASRDECFAAAPDFLVKRDEYYSQLGGSVVQTVTNP